jgi:tetraacyldisaccharide 4'-kinase
LLFQTVVALRRQLYAVGIFKTQRVDALVIVVGNVVVGGAGKTPTVIALVQHLQAQGRIVGVISRGYGRAGTNCIEVQSDSRPHIVGDEPLLIRKATHAPVFVGHTRHEAATALLARHPASEIIICDDGLQHYSLYRDLEICVFDDRGCGNGWCLPAGPLRERWPRRAVARVGQQPARLLTLHTGNDPAFAGYTAHRSLAPSVVRRDGATMLLSEFNTPDARPLVAIAGIAQPESFFSMLRARGLPLEHTIALPDHYHFDSLPSNIDEGYDIICTEKDAAKLWSIAPRAWAIPLVFQPEVAFFTALDTAIAERLAAKLSSGHGHQTT